MKIIAFKENDLVIWAFDDNEHVAMQEDRTIVGDPVQFHIGDCNLETAYLVENVTLPADFVPWKFAYKTGQWIQNPDWKPREAA